ncbi:MAG TPA: TIR domain-containing protein [Pyrinomonadaceae bacterium]|nr:TIR domain-containing protein [Pyrinomonadaceae bacterium]
MKTTIVEVIRQVMKAEEKPLTPREIYYHIMQQGLYDFKAKDPISVVGSQIRKHCAGKDAKSYYGSKFFQAVGKDKFQLLPEPIYQPRTVHIDRKEDVQPFLEQKNTLKQQNGNSATQESGVAKRTIILAIKEVMQSHRKPMTVQQVYDAIVSLNLYSFKASQPVHVVRSQIRRHTFGLDFPSAVDLKHFELRGKDKYYVLPKPVKQKSKSSQMGVNTDVENIAERQAQSASTEKRPRDKVFICYSHKDSKWLQRLHIHLKPLEKPGLIDRWDDTRISPGAKWRDEIKKAIERTRVAVMLISADFLASEFIIDNELPPLLQAAMSEGVMILPVIISPCRFEKTEGICQFQAVNSPSKPLTALDKTKREEIYVKVADAIEAALYPA